MTITWRLYSCDDHLDLWNLPRDLWEGRLPARLRERGPRVVEQGGNAWWTCDGSVLGPFGMQMMKDYSAIARAGIEDDGVRAATAPLRLADMDRDGIHASVIYGPNLFGLPIADPELHAAVLAGYNDWARDFNRHDPARLSVLPVLPAHTPAVAIAELERVAKAGHRGVIISPFEFRCADGEWERFWDAAEETGLPVSFHIGRGTSQVRVAPRSWELAAFSAVGPMQLDEPLAMMVYSGVLERHPCRGDGEVDEPVVAADLLAVHVRRRVEVRDLGGDLAVERGRIERGNPAHAGPAFHQRIPERLHAGPDRTHHTDAGDRHSPVHCVSFRAASPGAYGDRPPA